MNYILEFKNYYKEGDKILIEYWYDSHLTPVIIKEIKTEIVHENLPEKAPE
jgi:hypothetical protein